MSVERLLGSWTLMSWQIPGPDGAPHYPLGQNAEGLLVYAPDGYMFAALMTPGRPGFLGADPLAGSDAECASAMHGYHTYCGRWRLETDRVIHTVTMALFPNMIGSEQVRFFRF